MKSAAGREPAVDPAELYAPPSWSPQHAAAGYEKAGLRTPPSVVAGTNLRNRRRVRVTYVVPGLEIGGAERQLVKLVNNLDRDRFEPAIVCLGADSSLLQEVAGHVRVRCLGLRGNGRRRRLLTVARGLLLGPLVIADLAGRRPDVVHCYLPAAYIVAGLAAHLLRIRVIVASRMTLSRVRDYPHRTLRVLAHPANRVIDFQVCDSEAARQVVLTTERVAPERTLVIHSGSQLPDLSVPALPPPAAWRLRPGQPAAVSVANLRWPKGHGVLLRAVAEVMKVHSTFRLVLVGEGAERPQVERLIAELGLRDTVVVAGLVGEASGLLPNFQFSVLASIQESFPNAVVESMAAGLPVIGTRVGGIPELVRDGEDGLLVPPRDPGALAQAMLTLLRQPELAERMGRTARERIRNSFSIEKMVSETQALYTGLLRGAALDGLEERG